MFQTRINDDQCDLSHIRILHPPSSPQCAFTSLWFLNNKQPPPMSKIFEWELIDTHNLTMPISFRFQQAYNAIAVSRQLKNMVIMSSSANMAASANSSAATEEENSNKTSSNSVTESKSSTEKSTTNRTTPTSAGVASEVRKRFESSVPFYFYITFCFVVHVFLVWSR